MELIDQQQEKQLFDKDNLLSKTIVKGAVEKRSVWIKSCNMTLIFSVQSQCHFHEQGSEGECEDQLSTGSRRTN